MIKKVTYTRLEVLSFITYSATFVPQFTTRSAVTNLHKSPLQNKEMINKVTNRRI